MPSGPDSWEEEWKEDDLEDLDPDSSGGEFGVVQMVVISYSDYGRFYAAKSIDWMGCGRNWRRSSAALHGSIKEEISGNEWIRMIIPNVRKLVS